MNNYKQGRVNEEVKRALSNIIREIKDPRVPSLISVAAAKVSADLKYATIYVSVLGTYDEKELMKGLKAAKGFLRKRLGEVMQMRAVPELTFEIDRSAETGARINELLKGLDK
ncbi:MAG: 30S ribosome-binding factor RbfA [Clostridiales bacterium]|nr:MAG: 30S ribosome-binding factor RbfA [Clostridiales bacterium]